MPSVIAKFGATEFENVCLGAPSLETGIAFLLEKTGQTAIPLPVADGDWNRSAILHTQSGAVIEVLAPNPEFRGLSHLGAELTHLSEPQLIFWSLRTTDFDEAVHIASFVDHPVVSIQARQTDIDGFRQSVKVVRLGPDENMVRPVLAHYDVPTDYPHKPDPVCLATALHLSDWDAPPLNRLLSGLGVDIRAVPGPRSLRLDLETPKGPVTLESGDWIKSGLQQRLRRIGREGLHLFRGRRSAGGRS